MKILKFIKLMRQTELKNKNREISKIMLNHNLPHSSNKQLRQIVKIRAKIKIKEATNNKVLRLPQTQTTLITKVHTFNSQTNHR